MSYRYYFLSVPKQLVSEVKACKTNAEYISVCKKHQLAIREYGHPPTCVPYYLGSEIHEFGPEVADNFYGETVKCDDLFSGKLQEEYHDNHAKICTPDTFVAAIHCYADQIERVYRDLLREKSEFDWEYRTQLERLKAHVGNYLHCWDNPFRPPYDLDLSTPSICNSWLYEHMIFELVRCYKTFDWENNDLIFMGW